MKRVVTCYLCHQVQIVEPNYLKMWKNQRPHTVCVPYSGAGEAMGTPFIDGESIFEEGQNHGVSPKFSRGGSTSLTITSEH